VFSQTSNQCAHYLQFTLGEVIVRAMTMSVLQY